MTQWFIGDIIDVQDDDFDMLKCTEDELFNKNEKSIYKNVKYYIDIQSLVEQHKVLTPTTNDISKNNEFFNLSFIHEMERDFISMLPLWTFIVDNEFLKEEPIHFSTAPVESYFSEIKGMCENKSTTC